MGYAQDHEAIRLKVDQMSALLRNRDMAIVEEIWSPGFRLVGSEIGEVAESREQLLALFEKLFARAVRYAFAFEKFDVNREGNIAWLFAEGDLLADNGKQVDRFPYRLTAIFRMEEGNWRWRLFSGAEPAKSVESN